MGRLAWFLLPAALAACAAEPLDLCEEAARHREACLGDYVTPPACDADAERAAEALLAMDCAQLARAQDPGKADGAFCDWFGAGCKPDEPIFRGPACARHADCAAGASCLEGRCFGGVASGEMAAVLDEHVGRPEVGGNHTRLLVDNEETRALAYPTGIGARPSS